MRKPILVGHSSGASVALRYALNFPQDTSGLVLLSPAAFHRGISFPATLYFTSIPLLGPLLLNTLAPMVLHWAAPSFVSALFAPNQPPAGYREMIEAFTVRPRPFLAFASELQSLEGDLREQEPHYGDITVPVEIVAGAVDEVDQPKIQAIPLYRSIPGSHLRLMADTGHAVHHAHPRAVLDAIEAIESAILSGATPAARQKREEPSRG
jgi:pimeloyl-ACP methyl ester carboxylesterase